MRLQSVTSFAPAPSQVEVTGTLAFPSRPLQGQPLAAVPTPADGQEPSTALLDEGGPLPPSMSAAVLR